MKDRLLYRTRNRSAVAAVSGLGYVELPLAAAVVPDHSSYDWAAIRHKARLVVDTRNAMDQVLERTA